MRASPGLHSCQSSQRVPVQRVSFGQAHWLPLRTCVGWQVTTHWPPFHSVPPGHWHALPTRCMPPVHAPRVTVGGGAPRPPPPPPPAFPREPDATCVGPEDGPEGTLTLFVIDVIGTLIEMFGT